MTSRDFCYWLQGFFEIGTPSALDRDQLEMVKRHLSLVFRHEIDPSNAVDAKYCALHASKESEALRKEFEQLKQNPIYHEELPVTC